MKQYFALLLASIAAITSAFAESYSTEVTMTPQKGKGTYEVVVNVSQLVEQDGKITEKLLGQPKLSSPFGSPASMRIGPEPTSENYKREENVTVDASWPKTGETGVALCTVTIKRGDKVVSKSTMKFTLDDK